MDSGLGSDEDGRGRTKEQKQLRNQQLLSGCFIDAASLSDEGEIDQRRNDERRQGALIFQSSIPQFSTMLQMSGSEADITTSNNESLANNTQTVQDLFIETSTPFNSIVNIEDGEQSTSRKSPLGFYVDLNQISNMPTKTPLSVKKNIFSMVIDFEAPKKEKPKSLSSSHVLYKKAKLGKQLNGKHCGSSSVSCSSINTSVPGPSGQGYNCTEESPVLQLKNGCSSSEDIYELELNQNENNSHLTHTKSVEHNAEPTAESQTISNSQQPDEDKFSENIEEKNNEVKNLPQFVKLSDLECQKTRLEVTFTPRMSRSIPESSWVESPLMMSRSAGYRNAPRPLEPENEEMYDSFTTTTETMSVSQPRKSVQRLGTDLLRMFLEEIGPDVTIEVETHRIKAHKCILASRCQYFAAMLSGNWLENSGNVISLEGFSYESVYFSLCHIYSGAAHVPDSISVIELASLADMLGLEGLKEVVEHALKQRYCHGFHKPCAGCCSGVPEVLILSAAYGLDDLYQKSLQWIAQHFVKIWPSRSFSSLPRELRDKCYQQHVVNMTPNRVLETMIACEKIVSNLPNAGWAESVQHLVSQLTDACHLYHRQHYSAVLVSSSVLALDAGPAWCIGRIEDQMTKAASNLGVEQACRSYSRCSKMLEQAWSKEFENLLGKIKVQLEQCLVSQTDRLIRSNAWLRLESCLRQRIKEISPLVESSSRLPRATPKKSAKSNQNASGKTAASSQISSSDSSRNSSPGMKRQSRLQNANGSPSLRRSLLLAAKAPQVPPSPTVTRRSTLTQPTQASAAKSAPSKNVKSVPISRSSSTKNAMGKSVVQNNEKNITVRKNSEKEIVRKAEMRTQSPMKSDSRTSSPRKSNNLSSPIKTAVRSPSPLKRDIKAALPKKFGSTDRPSLRSTQKTNMEVKKPVSLLKNSNSFNKIKASKTDKTKLAQKSNTVVKDLKYPISAVQKSQFGKEMSKKIVIETFSTVSIESENHSPRNPARHIPNDSCQEENVQVTSRYDIGEDNSIENGTTNKKPPTMQRSSTFLKDEPTVLGKFL